MKRIELADVCIIRNGYAFKSAEFSNNGIPIVRIGEIQDGSIDLSNSPNIVESTKFNAFELKKEDILIAMSGATTGKIGIFSSDKKAYQNQRVGCFKPDINKLDNRYLYEYLKSIRNLIEAKANGGGQPNISSKELGKIKIPLPSLTEQKRIAKVLSHCEELIQKRKQSINLLDEFLKSTFSEMFGDPSENPKEWEVRKLGECIEYIGDIGSNGSNKTISENLIMHDSEDYAIMVRTVNLNSNNFKTNLKYVSQKTYEFFSKSKIFGGEIIMNKIGSAGKFWIMPDLNKPVSLGLNQFVIRLKELNTNYLYYFLSTNFGQGNINLRTNGATTKSITKSAVKDLPLLYPEMEHQIEFDKLVSKTETIKSKYQQSLQELENLYGSLSQKAFKGELDLSKVELEGVEEEEELLTPEMKKMISETETLLAQLETPKQIAENANQVVRSLEKFNEIQKRFENLPKLPKSVIDNINLIEKIRSYPEIKAIEKIENFAENSSKLEFLKKLDRKQQDLNELSKTATKYEKIGINLTPEKLAAFINKPYPKKKSKLIWEDVSTQRMASLIKEKYKGYHFNIKMLFRFFQKEHVITPDYYASSEIKKSPGLINKDDIKKFIFSAISINGEEVENPFIKLKQEFYNSEEENFVLSLTEEDYEMVKDLDDNQRSGIYLSIIDED